MGGVEHSSPNRHPLLLVPMAKQKWLRMFLFRFRGVVEELYRVCSNYSN